MSGEFNKNIFKSSSQTEEKIACAQGQGQSEMEGLSKEWGGVVASGWVRSKGRTQNRYLKGAS